MSIVEFFIKQTHYVNIFSSGEVDRFADERFVDGFFTVQYNRSAVKIQYFKIFRHSDAIDLKKIKVLKQTEKNIHGVNVWNSTV